MTDPEAVPELIRVRTAVTSFRDAKSELLTSLRVAKLAGVSANQLARECDGVMSRPTVLDVLKSEDGEAAGDE
ncbi:hypothetical protein F4553_008089 [Allocatelliglobosispora scoriae]|uniref:Uncharacterized protein n=1 Tax=Allocatelliglobosispora scoriae TaxID=643052 RepID=A0A841C442_9ACTN|nr:hypothetical protein [Allocatelliglobosispora scoriae]MBB5874655.1 hypothetical protein [Allocatelliglobosispora scoriae]